MVVNNNYNFCKIIENESITGYIYKAHISNNNIIPF